MRITLSMLSSIPAWGLHHTLWRFRPVKACLMTSNAGCQDICTWWRNWEAWFKERSLATVGWASSSILTSLCHSEFSQGPITEYPLNGVNPNQMFKGSRCPGLVMWLEDMSRTHMLPLMALPSSPCYWSQDDSAYLGNIPSEEEGTCVSMCSFFIREALQMLLPTPLWTELGHMRIPSLKGR